jgi:phospholipid transport system transporter-binding protein
MTASARPVAGELTFETVPALYQDSLGWFAGTGELVIDLAQVTRADSAGLALLIEWLRVADKAGCRARLANIPQQVQTLIRINGLHGALLSGSA